MSAMLEVKDLVVSYGKIKAVKGISFDVEQGSVVSLIGTNGAGKTTTLRTISGLLRPTSGSITFEGKDITKVAAHDMSPWGWPTPRGSADLPQLTVRENLMLGASPARTRISTETWPRSELFRSSRSATTSQPAHSPVANNKCSPWGAR